MPDPTFFFGFLPDLQPSFFFFSLFAGTRFFAYDARILNLLTTPSTLHPNSEPVSFSSFFTPSPRDQNDTFLPPPPLFFGLLKFI